MLFRLLVVVLVVFVLSKAYAECEELADKLHRCEEYKCSEMDDDVVIIHEISRYGSVCRHVENRGEEKRTCFYRGEDIDVIVDYLADVESGEVSKADSDEVISIMLERCKFEDVAVSNSAKKDKQGVTISKYNWVNAIFFEQDKISSLREAIRNYEYSLEFSEIAPPPKEEEKEVEDETKEEDKYIRSRKEISIHLDTILYYGDGSDWRIWINGEEFDKDKSDYEIVRVSRDDIDIRYKDNVEEIISEQGKLFSSEDNIIYHSEDNKIVADKSTGNILLTLEPREGFVSTRMEIAQEFNPLQFIDDDNGQTDYNSYTSQDDYTSKSGLYNGNIEEKEESSAGFWDSGLKREESKSSGGGWFSGIGSSSSIGGGSSSSSSSSSSTSKSSDSTSSSTSSNSDGAINIRELFSRR